MTVMHACVCVCDRYVRRRNDPSVCHGPIDPLFVMDYRSADTHTHTHTHTHATIITRCTAVIPRTAAFGMSAGVRPLHTVHLVW